MTRETSKETINQLLQRTAQLLERKRPGQAVRVARRAARSRSDAVRSDLSLSGTLIDAGSDTGKMSWVTEGIDIINQRLPSTPDDLLADAHYNLGNGYLTCGERERGRSPGTRPLLDKAVSHFDESLQRRASLNTRTNLAAALMAQGRWIEALDELNVVLEADPDHHVALHKRGICFIQIDGWLWRHSGLLVQALADHRSAYRLARELPVFQAVYQKQISRLEDRVTVSRTIRIVKSTNLQNAIWDRGLGLNLCPLCRLDTPDGYDVFTLPSFLGGPDRRPTSDELLDLVNSLHRDYGTSRLILLQAIEEISPPGETNIVLQEGTAGAVHDLRTGLLISATTGFFSLLNKTAYALNAYLHLGHDPDRVDFRNVWAKPGVSKHVVTKRSDIHPAIARLSTPALSALHRLAVSLDYGAGRYKDLRELRNYLEHHVVVPARKTSIGSRYYHSVAATDLRTDALRMAKIARAAIWYFGGTVWLKEWQRAKRAMRAGHNVVDKPGKWVNRL